MTLEEFKKKYPWAENMTAANVKGFLLQFAMVHLKTMIEKSSDAMKEFTDDCKNAANIKD